MKVNLSTIGSGYGATAALNANFDAIETAIENTLSRDGTTPNEMEANLDMNDNNILNVGALDVASLTINGTPVQPSTGVTVASAFQSYTFTATAGQTSFSVSPYTPYVASVQVEVNGLSLPPAEISVSGTNVVIPACSAGDEVVIRRYTDAPSPFPVASDITFTQAGTIQTRTVQSKLRDVVSVKDFGAVGDSNGTTGNGTDDTAAFQAAIDYIKASGGGYSLYVPEGTYRLTSRLLIDSAVRIIGEGCSPYVTTPGTRGNGSWLYFDHTGKGLQIDGTAALAGVAFEHFGTFRNQPTPGVGWAPTAHDYDIYVDNADVTIDDVVLLNPTKGFKLTNTNYGRLTIKRLRGQPLQIGIDIDECYDLPQISDVHFWPYWKDDANVHAYTLANLSAFYLQRVDNPQLVNIFTIYAKAGIQIHQSAAGTVSKLALTNADFDRGVIGIWFDNTVTAVTSSKITNLSTQAETGVSSTSAILIDGTNINLQLENISLDSCSNNALRVNGSGNYLSIGNCSVNDYNVSGIGFPAFEAANGNTIQFALVPKVTGGSGAPIYSTTGTILSDDLWVDFAPTVTATSGSITSLGAVACKYKKRGAVVDLFIDISITTNGTGAGSIQFTLPISAVPLSIGVGREIIVAGKTLSLQASSSACLIQNYDNTYPASSGCRMIGSISYRV